MSEFSNKLKKWFSEHGFDNLKQKANDEFQHDFSFWTEPMYNKEVENSNLNFKKLKENYSVLVHNRYEIINKMYNKISMVDKKEKNDLLYNAFLCTMVWGHIGVIYGRRDYFEYVFNNDHKNAIIKKLNNVRDLLLKRTTNAIKEAYKSMKYYGKNNINGKNNIKFVGPAFFTKYLYFLGSSMNWADNPKPLIYDSVMMNAHEAILYVNCESQRTVNNNNISDYLDYIEKMKEESAELGLEPGKLEALLFSKEGREFVNSILEKKPKVRKKGTRDNRVEKEKEDKPKQKGFKERYESVCNNAIKNNKKEPYTIYNHKPLGLLINVYGKKSFKNNVAYQSISITGYKDYPNKEKIEEMLKTEFSGEKENNTVRFYPENNDKIQYYAIININQNCLDKNGELIKTELIDWFEKHVQNLINGIELLK